MTVENTTNTISAVGDNSTVNFDFPFKIFNATDLKVYKYTTANGDIGNPLVLNTDYTVSFSSLIEGGTVTYTTAPLTTETSYIVREVPLTQATSYPVESNLPEKTFENSLDKVTMALQQIEEIVGRSLVINPASGLSNISLPSPSAGKALKWNTAEDGFINSTYDPDTSAASAAASAAAAATSASNAATSETNAAASAAQAAASAATINLPALSGATAGQGLKVNTGLTGYEFTDVVGLSGAGVTISGTYIKTKPDNITLENSGTVIKIKDSGVDTAQLADDAVENAKIGALAVDTAELADDAVTIDKIGAAAVNTTALKTATGSASGSLTDPATPVDVTLVDYCFFPNFYYAYGDNKLVALAPISTNNSDQVGRVRLAAYSGTDTGAQAYNFRYRYINSSDPTHWIYGLLEEGILTSIWEAEDHCPKHEPFGELTENQELVIFDSSDIENIKIKARQEKKCISQYILDNYDKGQKSVWHETYVVEHDEWDELEGENYPKKEKFTGLKKIQLTKTPKDMEFYSLKKKGL
jgi:hypothetical protein